MPSQHEQATLSRRQVLGGMAGLGAGAASLALPRVARAADARQPNIVIILVDDVGFGALGVNGQQFVETPHLDRMAAEGINFTSAYAGAAICAPSRCSLLTGMHTGHARVRDNSFVETGEEPRLLPEDTTFGQVLQAAGYATGIFGKWGFGDDDAYQPLPIGMASNPDAGGPVGDLDQNVGDPSHPLQKGFDEFVGMVRHHHATEGYFPNYLWDGNQRVLFPENADGAQTTYAPRVYTNRALDFIDRHRAMPFAVFLSLQLAHWPNHVESVSPYEDRPWTDEMKRYAAQITLADAIAGEVRAKLEELGLANDTLVIFSSDNGHTEERFATGSGDSTQSIGPSPDSGAADIAWNMSGGLRGSKHSVYDGGIRVPTVAWGPGIVADTGRQDDTPWAFKDLLPTFADLAGVAPPNDVDGTSIVPLLQAEPGADRPPVYWERPPYLGFAVTGEPLPSMTYAQAVRRGRWKLIRFAPDTSPDHPDGDWRYELYDLDADRGERINQALAQPEVVAELTAIMASSHAPRPFDREPWEPSERPEGQPAKDPAPLPSTGAGLGAMGLASLALAGAASHWRRRRVG
ncbi:MAG: sulfatase-like hydrolase/transferase [Nitriliruptorales bacterium]|nr:sulfatase-like hydrolase/transferase [Nitriliruptorales bacterium]